MPDTNYKLCEWCEEAEGSLCQKCGFRYVCYDCLKHNPLEPTEPLCPACKRDLVKGVEIARSIVEHHSKRLGFQKPIWLPLEKENKMAGKTFDRMRDWRNFAEHMSAYIKENVLKKYQADGKDERVDLMHFQTAKAAAWNCLKYGLRIFNGAGKRHDWEKIAHYAEIGWHLDAQEKERKERKETSLTFQCDKCSHNIEYKTFGCRADPSRLPTTCPGCKQDGITWKLMPDYDDSKIITARHEIDHVETIEKHEAEKLAEEMKTILPGNLVRCLISDKVMVVTDRMAEKPTDWVCRYTDSNGDFAYGSFDPKELIKLEGRVEDLVPCLLKTLVVGRIYRHRLNNEAVVVLTIDESTRSKTRKGYFKCRMAEVEVDEDFSTTALREIWLRPEEVREEGRRERLMREKFGKTGSIE